MEGARNQFGNALDLVDFWSPTAWVPNYGAIVHLLEGFALAHAALDLAHEQDHGRGVLLAMCTPASALEAPGPRVTIQMPGSPVSLPWASAIMAAPPSLAAHGDLDAGVVQAVEHGQVAFARHAEHMLDAMGGQLVDQDMAAEAGCGVE